MRPSRLLAPIAAVALGVLATLAPVGPSTAASAGGPAPAPVKVTLKPNATGRVISDRAACVRQRDVYGFLVGDDGQATPAGQTTTDRRGRYPGETSRRGTPTDAFTLVLGNARCRVAQSPTIAVSPRAAAPAKRTITLQANPSSASGRVTSTRPGCVRHVEVVLFVRSAPGTPFMAANGTETDRRGRYSFGADGRRGQDVDLLTVVFGDGACRVAQSPTRSITPS